MIRIPLGDRTVPRQLAAAQARGMDRPFLVTREATYTHGDTEAIVAAIAGRLAGRGVAAASRVAVFHANTPRYVFLLLALARLGAVAVALNVEARGRILTYYLRDSDCALGIVDAANAATFAASAAEAGGPPTVELPDGEDWIERLGPGAPREATEDVAFSDCWVILYTSGTTGMPKGVPVSHAHAMTCGAIFVDRLGLTADDRLYTCLPFFHVNATAYTLSGALVSGASIALGPRFSARRFWDDCAALGATEVNAMGSMAKILESRDPHPGERAHALRTMWLAPLPADPAAVASRFGLQFATVYAQTEWLPSSFSRPGECHGRPDAAGPVLPYSEVAIVDQHDAPLPPGSTGEIALRAHEPYVTFQGYLGNPEASLEVFRNLRFHTGDLGMVSEDGWLHFRGRVRDTIRRRGENISALALEDTLATHPDVAEVAAVPVPSSVMEDDVFAYAVLREGAELDPRALERFAQEVLPRHMVPLYVQFLPDLPRTSTNKTAKEVLRARAREAVERGEVRALR